MEVGWLATAVLDRFQRITSLRDKYSAKRPAGRRSGWRVRDKGAGKWLGNERKRGRKKMGERISVHTRRIICTYMNNVRMSPHARTRIRV